MLTYVQYSPDQRSPSNELAENRTVVGLRRYTGALQLLCDQAGFLVDSKLHKMLVELPSHDESGMVRSDSIVKALGVTDGSSFEALMAALSVGKSEGLGSQNVDDPTLVHPADAVTRLRQFVEAENSGAAAAPTIGLAGMLAPGCHIRIAGRS